MKEFFLNKTEGEKTNFSNFWKAWNELKDGWVKIRMHNAKQRSSPQNRYFHGPMLDAVLRGLRNKGFNEVKDKEDAKLVVKELFLRRSFTSDENGDCITYTQDTHNLTKDEMTQFIEDIIQWAAVYLDEIIPYPNEQLMMPYEIGYVAQPRRKQQRNLNYKITNHAKRKI